MRYLGLVLLITTACDTPGISEDTDLGDPDTSNADGDTELDTDVDIDTSNPETCTATLASTDPTANHGNFPVNTPLTAWFTAPVAAGEYSLSVSGVTGSTTLAQDGLSAIFTPSADLAFETDYTFSTSVCGRASTVAFHTASAPIDASELTNKTYAMDYDDVVWVAPSIMDSFSNQIPVDYILLHIAEANVSEQSIDAVGALGLSTESGIEQDTCQDTFGFGPQDFTTNPVFRIGPTTLSFPVSGQDVSVDNAFIEAVFVDGGDAIEDITISGTLDTRPLDAALPLPACTLLACTPCSDGVAKCVDVFLTVDRAPDVPGLLFTENPTPAASCP